MDFLEDYSIKVKQSFLKKLRGSLIDIEFKKKKMKIFQEVTNELFQSNEFTHYYKYLL